MTPMAAPMDPLPEWQVDTWLNSRDPITLQSLRGKVVVIHAFQMLCPACVSHGLPQAERVRRSFSEQQVAVIGLHTVFEHHQAMTADALRAFVREYRWSFPIGIDRPADKGPVPQSMSSYGLRGTPTLIVLDRHGKVRLHHFGRAEDLLVGASIGQLLAEVQGSDTQGPLGHRRQTGQSDLPAVCGPDGCAITGNET